METKAECKDCCYAVPKLSVSHRHPDEWVWPDDWECPFESEFFPDQAELCVDHRFDETK